MPYKTGKMKGELTTPEIRKLIKAHNVLVSIKIPKGSKREDIIKLVEKNGYKVDHEKQALVPKVEMKRRPKVDMKKAEKVLPKPKTAEEKAAAKKVRVKKQQDKETQAFKKRDAQVKALGKVVARRKKGEIKKPQETIYPTFDSIKKLEKYFIEQINKFMKNEGMRFINKIKSPKMTEKQIKDERRDLRKLYSKRVLDILEANEDLFEDDDEKYEELEELYEKRFEPISNKVVARIKELKKK
tara:strand:- start:1913 stop:2638 length:726 start_codon:yes stop_codon:yes gene_type:complete